MDLVVNAVAAAVVTAASVRALASAAGRLQLIDRPGGRKNHQGEVPLVGGLAMLAGFLICAFWLMPPELAPVAVLTAAVMLALVGAIDDRFSLSARVRFPFQIAAALVMVYGGGVAVHSLGDLLSFGEIALGPWAVPFTVVGVVGAINAMNMADGMDGLAGGLALVAVIALAGFAWLGGLNAELSLLLILAGALVGFLFYNARTPWRSRAGVFMGDAGSMFLGFLLAWFMVRLTQGDTAPMTPVVALWIFALPLIDTLTVMSRRMLEGRSPFKPDRQHLHHILLLVGFSVPQAGAIMLTVAGVLAAVGVLGTLFGVPDAVMFLGFLGLLVGYYWTVSHIWQILNTLQRDAKDTYSAAGAEAR
jgi:UDP-GlcNAc:undecaprenyl-phosphate/decaprenyl-phosphate GlcNAc-1-phosphate transferase